MRHPLVTAFALTALMPAAHAYSIDFGESGSPAICSSTSDGLGTAINCANYSFLLQTYGDVAGVSDISYSAPRLAGQSLRWWGTNYNDLYGVAWADGGDGDSQARIEIKAVNPGDIVTLLSFDLGAYPTTTRSTSFTVSAIGGGTPLASFSGSVGSGSVAATTFTPAVSAVGGLWLTWQDSAYNVGIDHIQYSVSAVPEPGALALMLAGLGAVGLRARRRG